MPRGAWMPSVCPDPLFTDCPSRVTRGHVGATACSSHLYVRGYLHFSDRAVLTRCFACVRYGCFWCHLPCTCPAMAQRQRQVTPEGHGLCSLRAYACQLMQGSLKSTSLLDLLEVRRLAQYLLATACSDAATAAAPAQDGDQMRLLLWEMHGLGQLSFWTPRRSSWRCGSPLSSTAVCAWLPRSRPWVTGPSDRPW